MAPKPPASGCTTTISASAKARVSAASAATAYAMTTAGPAMEMANPEPRNRPVPIAPPIAIIPTWRLLSSRRSPVCCGGAVSWATGAPPARRVPAQRDEHHTAPVQPAGQHYRHRTATARTLAGSAREIDFHRCALGHRPAHRAVLVDRPLHGFDQFGPLRLGQAAEVVVEADLHGGELVRLFGRFRPIRPHGEFRVLPQSPDQQVLAGQRGAAGYRGQQQLAGGERVGRVLPA